MMTLTEQQRIKLGTYPKVKMNWDELESLPEYSLSNPTQGNGIGIKKWRRKTPVNANDKEAIWFLGEIKGGKMVFSVVEFIDKSINALDDKSIMPFGKHKGKLMENVPENYLVYLYGEIRYKSDLHMNEQLIKDYIEEYIDERKLS